MAKTEYNVVILTRFHTIMGTVDLYDKRLSDLLNDERHAAIRVRDARVSRLASPGKVIEQHSVAIISKDEIVIAFEPQPPQLSSKRLYGYVKKTAHKVFMLLDRIELRGCLHTTSGLELDDIHRFITVQRERFLPITQATVNFCDDERYIIHQDALIVNLQRMHYIAKIEEARPAPLPARSNAAGS